MAAYYNEIDPFAAQWLRNLIAADHIAPGVVDERSIAEVDPCELVGFRQCHFFAGIGVWSYALRLAGWPDDREVWTGSCPCQPFSAAGKRGGVEDERHLWPEFFRLISIARPRTVFGEQVASKDGLAWLDIVSADLERAGYAVGAVDTCAAGFGAPHIRQRLYFVADADEGRSGRDAGAIPGAQEEAERRVRSVADGAESDCAVDALAHCNGGRQYGPRLSTGRERQHEPVLAWSGEARGLADAQHAERRPEHGPEQDERDGQDAGRSQAHGIAGACSEVCRVMGDTDDARSQGRRLLGTVDGGDRAGECPPRTAGATNGFWRDADWLPCIDGKARPVEPGTFPLAHGATARVGRLRAYGNAINARQAAGFIEAYLE